MNIEELSLDDLRKAYGEQKTLIDEQQVQIEQLEGESIQLKADAAKLQAGVKKEIPANTKVPELIKVGGKKYKFALPAFFVPGHGKMTAEELSVDEEALSKIIATEGQNILKEIK